MSGVRKVHGSIPREAKIFIHFYLCLSVVKCQFFGESRIVGSNRGEPKFFGHLKWRFLNNSKAEDIIIFHCYVIEGN